MGNITLWIDGKKADTNGDTLIQLTYQQGELDNPTIIRNSYSQAVTLPATDNNNRIFGGYYRLDRVTGTGFDPMVRTPFQILDQKNTLLVDGYLKLDEVTRNGDGIYSYSVSLFGGLGGFFYKLNTRSSGEPLNLGDLTYIDGGYRVRPNDNGETMYLVSTSVADTWREACALAKVVPDISPWSFFLRFAPMYNGLPEGFDCKKTIVYAPRVGSGGARDFDVICLRDGQYSHWSVDKDCLLVSMESDKNEWEMHDFRAYLQRPVVNVEEVLKAIAEYDTGYSFLWSSAAHDVLKGLWLTLTLPKRSENYDSYLFADIFAGSLTPAALLTGIARTFGFMFRIAGRNEVLMATRGELFTEDEPVDISGRIDYSREVKIKTNGIGARYYLWQADSMAEGAYAKEYKDKYGRQYGSLLVDTSYQFSTEEKKAMEKVSLRGGVMAVKTSQYFIQDITGEGGVYSNFRPRSYEGCTYTWYKPDGVTVGGTQTPDLLGYGTEVWVDFGPLRGYDVAERLQCEDASQKGVDGSGILLYEDGYDEVNPNIVYHVSDDDAAFAKLNSGIPMWDMRRKSPRASRVTRLPRYTRYHEYRSLDFGYPKETQVPWLDTNAFVPVYEARWADYFADRMDKDTKVVRCTVDLSGMQVGNEMLTRFYYFGNSLWALSKIENYLITGDGKAVCEFIKVQDMENYF